MSTNPSGPPRLPPWQQMIVLLDEISGRLEDQTARGALRSETVTVGTSWFPVIGGWFSASIYNDGDADVYVRFGDTSTLPWEEGEAPLKSGENLPVSLRGRKYRVDGGSPVIYLICREGTASVRVFKLF